MRVIDDLSSGRAEDVPRSAEMIFGDILDARVLDHAFRGGVDTVFHLASLFANQNSVDHPERDLLVNGLGTLRVLERAREFGVRRFVFASSSCVYGRKEGACREDNLAFHPETPYAITKLLGERYMAVYQHFYHVPTVIVRYFNVYGPGEWPGKYRNVIPNFFALALRNEALPVMGDGMETRDFTFVSDAVSATIAAAASKAAIGCVYNIGSGVETTILTLAEHINRISGNSGGIVFRPPRRWDGITRRCADITRAVAELNYRPKIFLEEGLAETYRWFIKRGVPGGSFLDELPSRPGREA